MAKSKHQLSNLKSLEPEPSVPGNKDSNVSSDKTGKTPDESKEGEAKDVKSDVKSDAKLDDNSSGNSSKKADGKSTVGASDDKSDKNEAEKLETASDSKLPDKQAGLVPESKDALAAAEAAPASAAASSADIDAPPPPPRPKLERKESGFTVNLKELEAAFPDTDGNLRRAILVAANNNLESAFTGILALSDPTIRPAKYVKEQIEGDEQLARKLAMSDQRRMSEQRRMSRDRQNPARRFRPSGSYAPADQASLNEGRNTYDEDYYGSGRRESEESVYEGLQKGLSDTRQVVSSLWGNLKSRINGEIYDDPNDLYEDPNDFAGRRHLDRRLPEHRNNASAGLGIHHEPTDGPQLPPRRVSTRDSNLSTGTRTPSERIRKSREPKKEPLDAVAAPANEPRSVNAFGDEQSGEADQEPDAFFIGESDDDLGSLNEENLEEEAKNSVKADDSKADENKHKNEDKTNDANKDATKEDTADEDTQNSDSAETKNDKKDSEARNLLNKMKTGSEKK